MSVDYKTVVPEFWHERLCWDRFPDDLKEQLGRFAMYMYSLGKHVSGEIDQVKYDGRL